MSRWMMVQLEELARLQVKAELVTLKVVDQEGRVVKHRMRATDELQAVMDRYYAEAPEVGYGPGTFLVDGAARLRGGKTPADLKLEDGAQIDFFPCADGGGRRESDDA
ncbi:hypothetical protein C2845_PM04G30260 [Panicum miliaceum]|uniref:Rad60/SUMO-like domain-containing protein n=1 Tax=Panicum miliaceum TaxID=4540 RepID=A0A3L6QRZ2_PANMI|nr:hypothetical protein C2845_PM04G30260 [Panicum miliaceum]